MLIRDKEKLKEFYSEKRIWQGIPAIERSKNGRLFATFYSGTDREFLGNYSPLIYSDDGGENWSEPICCAYDGEYARCFDPVLWTDPLGRLWFIWNQVPDFSVYASICENPDAPCLEWSEEFFVANGIMICKPTVLSDGEWLFPVAVWDFNVLCAFNGAVGVSADIYSPEFIDYNSKNTGANVYRSVDNGKTFTFLGGCKYILGRSYDEHMIYEKKNGVLVMLTRTVYGINKTCSYDGGKTWTIGEDSGIAGPGSRMHIRRLKSGRLLMVNHYNYTGRNNLTAFLSDDDGETWPYKLMIDERNDVSYPDTVQDEEGRIYIIYDRERGGYKASLEEAQQSAREILLAGICEEDIVCGKIVNEGSYLKRIVSKLSDYTGGKDYYSGRRIENPDEFIKKYPDAKSALEKLFDYYPIKCQAVNCVDYKKFDKLITGIRNYDGDIRSKLKELIELINAASEKADKTTRVPVVECIIEYLQKNIAESVNLSDMAEELRISVYYMCRLFKSVTGLTIIEYRNSYRFTKAKELLVRTDYSVTQISRMCGFDDSCYFALKFKEREGMPPNAYRGAFRGDEL